MATMLRNIGSTQVREDTFWVGESCTQWLCTTVGPDGASAARALVIVAPFGIEALGSDRTLRALAQQVAVDKGVAVLVSSPDCADGTGDAWNPDRWSRWTDAVQAGIEIAKTQTFGPVAVFGMRLGALIGADACTADVAGLALWAPVIRGRQYLRELTMLANAHRSPVELATRPDSRVRTGDTEVGGFVLSAELAADINKRTLLDRAPTVGVLVIDRDDIPTADTLVSTWREAGVIVDQRSVPGYANAKVDDPEAGQVAIAVNAAVVEWLRSLPTGARADHETIAPTPNVPVRDRLTIASSGPGGDIVESISFVGPQHDIFAIRSSPAAAAHSAPPGIVIMGTGSNLRSGPGDLSTRIARSLAGRGYDVIRYDRRGVGCSNDHLSASSLADDVHADHHLPDALSVLSSFRHDGPRRAAVIGLCSGAWLGYHLLQQDAPSGAPELAGLISLNQLVWDDLSWVGFGESRAMELRAGAQLKRSVLAPSRWRDLIAGRIPVRQNAVRLGRLGVTLAKHRIRPPRSAIDEQLRAIERRGRWQFLVFDAEDLGRPYLRMHAADTTNRLTRSNLLSQIEAPGLGHTFGPDDAKAWLLETIDNELTKRLPASPIL